MSQPGLDRRAGEPAAAEPSSIPQAGRRRVALVLAGGGARAAYQLGVLRYLARMRPDFRFDIITGTSAGAINAAFLAAHHGTTSETVHELSDIWCLITFDRVFRTDTSELAGSVVRWATRLLSGGSRAAPRVRALLDTTPLRGLLTTVLATVDGEMVGVADNIERGRLEALALSTISYTTGQTVTWVQGREPTLWERPNRRSSRARMTVDHVMASAALPLLFPAVRLGSHWYGDGGVRMSAPLAPAIHLGADALLAIATHHPRTRQEAEEPQIHGYPPPAQVVGTLLNSVFLDVFDQDSLTLERINRLVAELPPGSDPALRPIDLEVIRPSQDLGRMAGEHEVRIPKGLRFLTRGLGTRETASPDLLSMLMFEPEYLSRLIRLGERDGEAAEDRIDALLGPPRAEEGASRAS